MRQFVTMVLIVCVFAVSGCGLFSNNKNERKVTIDQRLGLIASARAADAQYLPDVAILAASKKITPSSFNLSAPVSVERIDAEGYSKINEKLAVIDGEGAGKHLGYDIFEIKNEIDFVLKTVPAFSQWFRLSGMRAEQGFVSVPYYEGWAYYLESDEEAKEVTITRVSQRTRFSYWDFENDMAVENYEKNGKPIDLYDKNHPNYGYSGDKSIVQHQVMQTKYYFDEQGREVVECFVYSVAIDKESGTEFNGNERDYKPLSIQYLKNVKDTSLTRYQIRMSEFYDSGNTSQPDGNPIGGYDIRGLNPHGSRFDFVQMDYKDADDISLLRVTGELPVPDGVFLKPQQRASRSIKKQTNLFNFMPQRTIILTKRIQPEIIQAIRTDATLSTAARLI